MLYQRKNLDVSDYPEHAVQIWDKLRMPTRRRNLRWTTEKSL